MMKMTNNSGCIAAMLATCLAITTEAATVRVAGGAWSLGNKLSATNFILDSAATLSGAGEIRAPATLAGTVSPGSSTADIGTLSFSDQVAFNSGVFVCYAATDTSLDRISVTGNVTGAATVLMTRAAGVAPLQQIIIKGGAASDYTAFGVSPSTEWALGQANALDLIVSLGQLPPAPQNVVASDGTYANQVALSWSAASGATGYQVWRHTANSSSSATLIGTAALTSYSDTSSAVGISCYYWIKAANTIGAGAFSSSDSGWRRGIVGDYDGDGRADPVQYDATTGTWKVMLSGSGYGEIVLNAFLGGPGWVLAAADYDGDGKTDPAVYQEATGSWSVRLSGDDYFQVDVFGFLGGPGWMPAPADYEGDGKADPAVYQETTGSWKAKLSSSGYTELEANNFLGSPGFSAIPADYEGDGKADPAVYNRTNGTWKVLLSGNGYALLTLPNLGGTGWTAVPADYDGDGLADPAVHNETTGEWRVLLSGSEYALFVATLPF